MDFIGDGGHQKILEYPFGSTHPVWETLSEKLERPKKTLYEHFLHFIKARLTNHVHGVDEDQDTTLLAVEACVDNNWVYLQDIDWDKLINDQRFEGKTGTQLRQYYRAVKRSTMRKYPEIKYHEVTSEFILRRYLNERTQGKK